MTEEKLSLRSGSHQSYMLALFGSMLHKGEMVDVTLACDGATLKAHKVILSASSPFFYDIFTNNPCKHPIVILKDVSSTDLQNIITFIYHGQVDIFPNNLESLLKTAEMLKIKGLSDIDQTNPSCVLNMDTESSSALDPDIETSSLGKRKRLKKQLPNRDVFPGRPKQFSNEVPSSDKNVALETMPSSQPAALCLDVSMVKEQPLSPSSDISGTDFNLDLVQPSINIDDVEVQNKLCNQSAVQVNSSENILHGSQALESFGCSNTHVEGLQQEIVNLKQEITNLKQALNSNEIADQEEIYFMASSTFPLKDDDSFRELEKQLKDNQFKKKVLSFLMTIGGTSFNDTIHRIMRIIWTNQFSSTFSLCGTRDKKPFQRTQLHSLVCLALCLSPEHKSKSHNIDKIISKWLRGSNDRDGGRRRRTGTATGI